ncbi:hypothetical protein N2152v2_008791 [Parachlorella kessleri]
MINPFAAKPGGLASQPVLLDASDTAPLTPLSSFSSFDPCSFFLLDNDGPATASPHGPAAAQPPSKLSAVSAGQQAQHQAWGNGMAGLSTAAALQVAPSLELLLDLDRAGLGLPDPAELAAEAACPPLAASALQNYQPAAIDWTTAPLAATGSGSSCWDGFVPGAGPTHGSGTAAAAPFASSWVAPLAPVRIVPAQPSHRTPASPLTPVPLPAAVAAPPTLIVTSAPAAPPLQPAMPAAGIVGRGRAKLGRGLGSSHAFGNLVVETPVMDHADPGRPASAAAHYQPSTKAAAVGAGEMLAPRASGSVAAAGSSWVSSQLEASGVVPRVASTANFGGLVGAGADPASGSAWAAEPAMGGEAAGGRMRRQAGAADGEEGDGLVRIKSETDMSDAAFNVPHMTFLTPPHMRRGKGGRQPAPDPRLENPEMDPKRARRIMANRLSAAKSKLKQKTRLMGVQHQLGQLKGQKAALAAELDNYMAACKAEEEAQALLTRQIQVLQGSPGAIAW